MGTQFADITCKESLAVYLVPNQVTRSLKCKGVIPPPRKITLIMQGLM